MDEWVSVEDDLPQLGPDVDNRSITVRCKTETGKIRNGFYDYQNGAWYSREDKRQKERVTHWQSKEEEDV